MRKTHYVFLLLVLYLSSMVFAYNGKIISKRELKTESLRKIMKKNYKLFRPFAFLNKVKIYSITYLSDGLKVEGFLSIPRGKGKFPIIIYNRGGNKNFGAITVKKLVNIIGRVSSWGYVVAASQYRGNMGGEGKEEFGGKDVNDILNLISIVKKIKKADSNKIGLFGWSRGGMMTYLVLKKVDFIKAAVVGGGLSDLFMMMESRPEMEDVYIENIPGYRENKEKVLKERSAVFWADKICKKTPILILHGTADWRVIPQMSLKLAAEFLKVKQPFRLILFEGGDHALSEFGSEVFIQTKHWFKRFLKDEVPFPNLTPHGR